MTDTTAGEGQNVVGALQVMRERALFLTNKYGNPNGTDYEQGVNDHGHRWVTQIDDIIAGLALAAQPSAGAQGGGVTVPRLQMKMALANAIWSLDRNETTNARVEMCKAQDILSLATPGQPDTVNVAALLSIPGNTGSRALGRESSRFDGES